VFDHLIDCQEQIANSRKSLRTAYRLHGVVMWFPGKFFFFAPQLGEQVSRAPVGTGWVHEIKLDGYRSFGRFCRQRAPRLRRQEIKGLAEGGDHLTCGGPA
jgi:hypothetical protein